MRFHRVISDSCFFKIDVIIQNVLCFYPVYYCPHLALWIHKLTALPVNSLVPGRCGWNLNLVIFKLTSRVDTLSISGEIALRWMPQDFTDDKSTLVQVMAWCRQATSHYLGQCRPRSISPYGVTRPQWVNLYGSHHILWYMPDTFWNASTGGGK